MSGSWRTMVAKVQGGKSGKYDSVEKVKSIIKDGSFTTPDLTPEMIEQWTSMTITAVDKGWETKHRCVQLAVIMKEKGFFDNGQVKRLTTICNTSVDKGWETADDCSKFLDAKSGSGGGEKVVWMKMTAKELMSKDSKAGKMTFNQKVSVGCTTDMKIAAKVYGEVSGKVKYGCAEVSGKAGFEVNSSFQMTNSKASETTKTYEMPDGSPGYVYQMCVEAKTNKGNRCAWSCNLKMTAKPLTNMMYEQTFGEGK